MREPKTVLSEIAASATPDTYLQSLHPKHEQFQRLRKALLKARGAAMAGEAGRNEEEIQRLLINMERWRWMPADLGAVYVRNNPRSSCCTWSRTGRRSTPTRSPSATSVMPRQFSPPTWRPSSSIRIGPRRRRCCVADAFGQLQLIVYQMVP